MKQAVADRADQIKDQIVTLNTSKEATLVQRCLWVFLFVYFVKIVYLALFVIAPWDVADEIGHLGYIKELATGNGFPKLLETKMDEEMWISMAGEDTEISHNWIAQHPPLYYLIMTPSWWIGSLFGDGFEGPLYTARVCNAILIILGLWILFRTSERFTQNPFTSICVVILVSAVPLISQTAAGVNNDSLIVLLSITLSYQWLAYYEAGTTRHLLRLGMVLGLCGITKYTLLPVMAMVSAFAVWYEIQHRGLRRKTILAFLALAWTPISLWIGRNLWVLGHALPTDIDFLQFNEPTQYSFTEFLQTYPLFTHIFRSFWGVFGWYGSEEDLVLTTLHLPGNYQLLYAVLTLLLAAFSLSSLMSNMAKENSRTTWLLTLAAGVLTLLVTRFNWFPKEASFVSWLLYLALFSTLISLSFGALKIWLRFTPKSNWRIRFQVEAIVLGASFLLIIFLKLHNYGNESGMMRGTHGRYFFACLSSLLVAWIIPGLNRLAIRPWFAWAVVMLAVSAEFLLWISEVIPFFETR